MLSGFGSEGTVVILPEVRRSIAKGKGKVSAA
jgi:hypothetical protein